LQYILTENQLNIKDMDKGQTHILKGILYEYGNGITIEDWELVAQRSIITEIIWDEETDEIHFFAGDMENDKHAEEIIPNEEELDKIYKYIVKNF
jgi:hypothetical protein